MASAEDSSMPRNDRSAVAEPEGATDSSTATNGVASLEGAPTPASEQSGTPKKAKRNPDDMGPLELINIVVRVPNELRSRVAETATEQNTSVPQLLAKMLADAYEYTLPKPQRAPRVKLQLSEEEKKERARQQQAKTRNTTKALLDAVEQGKIVIPGGVEALVAEFLAQQEAANKQAETEGAATDQPTPSGAAS